MIKIMRKMKSMLQGIELVHGFQAQMRQAVHSNPDGKHQRNHEAFIRAKVASMLNHQNDRQQ